MHFTDMNRQDTCAKYWAIAGFNKQKDFILNRATVTSPKIRANSKQYHCYKNEIEREECVILEGVVFKRIGYTGFYTDHRGSY